jgi:hypothetical protein
MPRDLVAVTAVLTMVTRAVTLSARSTMTPPYRLRSQPCAVCGVEFRPWRSDARHCSNACRQRAYRQRSKVNADA